jgi:nitroreductase/NAD-dependent dihydropyrimidine dehydrogenase PreA subunit
VSLFHVEEKTCIRDGHCVEVCPARLIERGEGGYPKPIDDADAYCIACGHCVAVCPTSSFIHRDLPLKDFPEMRSELLPPIENVGLLLRARRSIRAFTDEPVTREELRRLIELARYAPTGMNAQNVRWMVIQDRDTLASIERGVIQWMRWMIDHGPDAAASMRLSHYVGLHETGGEIILRGAPVLLLTHASRDDRLALSSATIALSSLELAACWAGWVHAAVESFAPLADAAGLPEGHGCFGAMIVGRPRYSYRRLVSRRPPDVTWR